MWTIDYVMTRSPLVVGSGLSIDALIRTLIDHRADGACVVDDGLLVGVVTTIDLAMRASDASFDDVSQAVLERKRTGRRVADLMSWPAVTVTEGARLDTVLQRMIDDNLSIVPVIDAEGALVGAVTRHRLLEAIASGFGARDA